MGVSIDILEYGFEYDAKFEDASRGATSVPSFFKRRTCIVLFVCAHCYKLFPEFKGDAKWSSTRIGHWG